MNVRVVLYTPQDIVNIAGVVRAMKNFGLRYLRLVRPAEYSQYRIEGIAHNTTDILKRVKLYEDLDEALADATHVVGMTARQRTVKRNVRRPREAAAEIAAGAESEVTALLLGPEDKGLSNTELDRCSRVVIIDTNPAHASLNLAQAFTVMAYELFMASNSGTPLKAPKRASSPVTHRELEELFAEAENALRAIEFFKSRDSERIMRTVREVVHRVPLDQRETKLFRAMCFEVQRYLERKGMSA